MNITYSIDTDEAALIIKRYLRDYHSQAIVEVLWDGLCFEAQVHGVAAYPEDEKG